MRPKSMILIVIALGCGLVASIGISQVMENRTAGPPAAPMAKIYVAVTDVPLGQVLSPKMVKLEEWPQDKAPEGAVRKLEDLEGRRPLTRLYPGEPILKAKLIDANKFYGASEKIPKGYRVASVKVTMDSSASGLINPGDRVDVLVFLKKGRGISMTGTRTILKNVTVFAVNDRFQRDPDEDAESSSRAKTVSLLVKPNQVEKVMLAQELGRIKLSLRRSDDDTEDAAIGATVADLDAGSAAENGSFSIAAATGEFAPERSSGGITDFLQGLKAMTNSSADTTKQAWVMHIHTPNSVQVFNWDDRNSLPRELLSAQRPTEKSTMPMLPIPVSTPSTDANKPVEVGPFDFSTEGDSTDSDSAAALLD
jgi:pilus assembly protein CpaB